MKLVLATHNEHKVVEVGQIIDSFLPGVELVGYDGPEPVEDGTSFVENALLKARAAFKHTALPSIADDSGIAVEILGEHRAFLVLVGRAEETMSRIAGCC